MGNDQSTNAPSTAQQQPSSFSFFNKGSVKKKGIVVVSDGTTKTLTVEDDEIFKRFQEIPRFLPILRNSVGQKESPVNSHQKLASRPVFKMASRLQEHVNICTKEMHTVQNELISSIKKVDSRASVLSNTLISKTKAHDKFVAESRHLEQLKDELLRAQMLMEEIVPVAEVLNELLLPSDRLPPLQLDRVLVRTPPESSGSSQHSTPRRGRGIPGVEEITVVDKA